MPSPATPHPRAAASSGAAGSRTREVIAIPAPMSTAPTTTTVRRIEAAAARAWSHAPTAPVTAAADRAMPPSVTLPPRTSTTVSGT